MASIITGNYGPGSKIVLKPKIPMNVLKELNKEYKSGDKFVIHKTVKNPDISYTFGSGKSTVYIMDSKNKIIKITGATNTIQNSFNHHSEKGKSNTDFLTDLKEMISMKVMLLGNTKLDDKVEEKIIKSLSPKQKDFYDSLYYRSAVKQNISLKRDLGIDVSNSYSGERQGKDKSKKLYSIARQITGLHPDNYNPADLWFIKKSYLGTYNKFLDSIDVKIDSISKLNEFIKKGIKDKTVLPISLKQVTDKERGSSELVYYGMKFQDINFDIDSVDMAMDSFNNFIIWTKSGFGMRVGYKSSKTSLSVYIEGRMKGSAYQLGAVDEKEFVKYTKLNSNYKLVDGSKETPNDDNITKIINNIYSKVTIKGGGTKTNALDLINGYNNADEFMKLRANNLLSFMNIMLVELPKKKSYSEIFEWCYFYSRKITENSSDYILTH